MSRTRLAVLTILWGFCGALGVTNLLGFQFSDILRRSNPAASIWNAAYPTAEVDKPFSWAKLPASKKLEWRDCLPERQCSRLIVPLNHADPHGREATIALIRIPAKVSPRSEAYRGPVLFNPGGPGSSGVSMIGGPRAVLFSKILGPEFDIVGFDPRGIGHSTPRASFFKTDVERALWAPDWVSVVNNSDDGIARAWARNQVVGQLAAEQDDGYLRHINTDQTAKDMLKIVEAHGRKKILYWGISYGTILGATFAAMFPDKIERLIIDGVVDSEDYYAGLATNDLIDTDKTFQAFFTGCADAGPTVCPFYEPTAGAIRQKLNNLYDAIRKNPLPIKTETTYGILDYGMLRAFVFTMLYAPWAKFHTNSQALAELAAGNGNMLFELQQKTRFFCPCDGGDHQAEVEADALPTISCNDSDYVPGDLESSKKYFEMMARKGEWGGLWSSIRLMCVGWPKFPKDQFRGPFVANTSHPILLIGNTADPVTPLWAAKKVSRDFKGSVVLTQDTPGHGSLSAPSLCTQKYVRDYFVHGTLPEPGTVCHPNTKPFPNATDRLNKAATSIEGDSQATLSEFELKLTADEKEIWDAIEELSRMPLIPRFL